MERFAQEERMPLIARLMQINGKKVSGVDSKETGVWVLKNI